MFPSALFKSALDRNLNAKHTGYYEKGQGVPQLGDAVH
jgi:hypothetical protein